MFFPADTVVTALGMKPQMEAALALYDCAPDFYLIGDSRAAATIREANWGGYNAVLDAEKL